MEQLVDLLLAQSPLVILMVIGYYVMLKEKKELKRESIADRKAYRKELKDLHEKYEAKTANLNYSILEYNNKFFQATDKLSDALERLNK